MMLPKVKKPGLFPSLGVRVILSAVFIATLAFCACVSAAMEQQRSFASAEEAVQAAVTAAKNHDDKELLAIFGSHAKALLFSGDAVADQQRRERFLKAYEDKHRIMQAGSDMILVIGNADWPFPIPVVKQGDSWVFDTVKGKEEILNRRIGENELNAIQVCLAIVDAQRQYAQHDHDGDGVLEYAQTFLSDPGKQNGLYWETKPGEALSPLGPLVAQARSEGYAAKNPGNSPAPYHGYYYRILRGQGKNASGGAYDYAVKGQMIGGFAVGAYPAEYGNSGVMTFIVNHDGIVYEKKPREHDCHSRPVINAVRSRRELATDCRRGTALVHCAIHPYPVVYAAYAPGRSA